MKYAVFITSGIGNAIFLIPLIKELKKTGSVTAIATSPFGSETIFNGFDDDLFEETIVFRKNWQAASLLSRTLNKFDETFIDFFGASRKNIMVASLLSQKVTTAKIPEGLNHRYKTKLNLVLPKPGLNEGIQILRFKQGKADDNLLNDDLYKLKPKPLISFSKRRFLTLQPGAGNNATQWKIWPYKYWLELTKMIAEKHSEFELLILGDEHDAWMEYGFSQVSDRVKPLFNKTKIENLPGMLVNSSLHIGGDSGLLHIAGTVGTATVTICGGSDEELFGWHKVNADKHFLIQNKLSCHPCYRWFLPNRERVENANDCPDFKCIRSISPHQVFKKIDDLLTIGICSKK